MRTQHRSLRRRLDGLLFRGGMYDLIHRCRPQRLTVLAYHRIADWDRDDFDTFKPNVSATPKAFAEQMDFAKSRFSIVTLEQVLRWVRGGRKLPPYPLLITFDDGYADNREAALPILRPRGLPATIFLATAHIGAPTPFFWDLAAHMFAKTEVQHADLPVIGVRAFDDADARADIAEEWVIAAKALDGEDLHAALAALGQALDVAPEPDAFAGLHLSWPEIAEMTGAGVDFGAHTETHQVLSRVSECRSREEIAGSKDRIVAELGTAPCAFAYPNGGAGDFTIRDQTILRELGFKAAFTLLPGPQDLDEARREPMQLRRILITRDDDLPQFAAKLSGVDRWAKSLKARLRRDRDKR